jgi:hypothetical protein
MKKLLLTALLFSFYSYSKGQTAVDTMNARLNHIEKIMGVLKDFRIVSYIQTEWQRAGTAGIASYAGGNFPAEANNRFLLRRGRFMLGYEHRNAKDIKVVNFTFQIDATERGVLVKELNAIIYDPWIGWFGLEGGIFRRQFGYETPASPAFSESPELARMNQIIFPNEYELGENLIVQSPKKFKPLSIHLDAGLVNGDGISAGSETGAYESRKDFLGRMVLSRKFDIKKNLFINLSAGASYYDGGVLQTTYNVYELERNDHNELVYTNIADSNNINKKYYHRDYYGTHLQFDINYKLGTTMLRGEYITGQQPGTTASSAVPTGVGNAPPGLDLYIRQFNGAIAYFTQTFKHKVKGGHEFAHDLTFKFDLYNPNTQETPKQLSTSIDPRVGGADVLYRTYGLGYVFRPYEWFKLMVWYDIVKNPSTEIKSYGADLKDNVLTIRTQFYVDTWWFTR